MSGVWQARVTLTAAASSQFIWRWDVWRAPDDDSAVGKCRYRYTTASTCERKKLKIFVSNEGVGAKQRGREGRKKI